MGESDIKTNIAVTDSDSPDAPKPDPKQSPAAAPSSNPSKLVGLGCAESWTGWLKTAQDSVDKCAQQIGDGACPKGSSTEYFLYRSFGVPNCGCVLDGFVDNCPVGKDGWDGEVDLRRRPVLVKWRIPVEPQMIKVGVGATVLFSWTGSHNVYEFTDADAFDKCDFSKGKATSLSDSAPFELVIGASATVRYFGCAVAGHCRNGQKLKLVVSAKTTTTTTTTTKSTTTAKATAKNTTTTKAIIKPTTTTKVTATTKVLTTTKAPTPPKAPTATKAPTTPKATTTTKSPTT